LGQKDAQQPVDFVRDVQPLLKAHCFQCHGGAQKQGGLNLDSRALLLKGGVSGPAITPGNSGGSLLVARLQGHDGSRGCHWASRPSRSRRSASFAPGSTRAPSGRRERMLKSIGLYKASTLADPQGKDARVGAQSHRCLCAGAAGKEGLKPSPEADRITLLRRVTLDLTGLPPRPKK